MTKDNVNKKTNLGTEDIQTQGESDIEEGQPAHLEEVERRDRERKEKK